MLGLRVLTAAVLLLVLLPILYFHSYPAFLAFAGVFFAVASWECFRLFGNKKAMQGAVFCTIAFGVLVYLLPFFDPVWLFALASVIWLVCLVPLPVTGLPELGGGMNRSINALYGLSLFSAFVAVLYLFAHSCLYLLSVLVLVWIADIGAYIFGKLLGRHKLAPAISPGKSWEGAIGGWLCVLLVSGASLWMASKTGWFDIFPVVVLKRFGWFGLILVLSLLVVLSIAGDLFESMLKRRVGLKDSSRCLPGHGGVLDRIDALIPVLSLAAFLDYFFRAYS